MGEKLEITGSLLARNTVLNFVGQVIPLFVAVVTIPYIIRGLGVERFGILSLAWMFLGYFAIFDLGLGRATTKFVAEAMGKGEAELVPGLVWTAAMVQSILCVIGGFVLVGVTPFLVECVLNIPLNIESAYLFGSQTKSDFLEGSDWDILIVSPEFVSIPFPERELPL